MNLDKILKMREEESGISTVIGSILLIVLVIGVVAGVYSYVGDTNLSGETTPQGMISVNDVDGDTMTLSMDSGESVDVSDLAVRGDGIDAEVENEETLQPGGSLEGITADEDIDGGDISIVYEPTGDVIAEYTD